MAGIASVRCGEVFRVIAYPRLPLTRATQFGRATYYSGLSSQDSGVSCFTDHYSNVIQRFLLGGLFRHLDISDVTT